MNKENPMREIRIEKVTLNIGAGESGPKLDRASKILEAITGKKILITKAHKRTPFGVAKGRPIGAKVTVRGEAALEMLKRLVQAVDNKLKESWFDDSGNFSFGIDEYINIPGIRYDPDIGILGMDVCITLKRPGFRIRKRGIRPKRIGKGHRISREDAMGFARKELGTEVVSGRENL